MPGKKISEDPLNNTEQQHDANGGDYLRVEITGNRRS
jgi:hypothetical protein